MTLRHIFNDLQSLKHQGAEATTAARAGFFQWILTQNDLMSAKRAAHSAIKWMRLASNKSQAAAEFTSMIGETINISQFEPTRRGGASARRRTFH